LFNTIEEGFRFVGKPTENSTGVFLSLLALFFSFLFTFLTCSGGFFLSLLDMLSCLRLSLSLLLLDILVALRDSCISVLAGFSNQSVLFLLPSVALLLNFRLRFGLFRCLLC
jgi:hypothetical protein